jgi:hypothetical protein
MLKNLYKTWGQLAPDEATFWDNEEAVTLQKNQPPCHTWVMTKPWLDGQDALEGYIKRCILSRGWWFELKHSNGYFSADIRTKFEDHEFVCGGKDKGFYYLLLTAYLRCVAAQRPVTTGVWQHFKGDEMEVIGKVGIGSILSPAFSMYSSDSDDFSLESDHSIKLRLFMHPVEPLRYCNVFHEAYYSDLVFYSHNSQGWARNPDSFLGLVGSEHPEHEGLLRFIQAQ